MTRRNRFLHGRPRWPALLLAVLLSAAVPTDGRAAGKPAAPSGGIDHNSELQACLRLAEAKPAEALESALAWQERGGGDLARLCQALALFHRGDFAAAGTRLEALAPVLGRDDAKAAAGLLGRAGWAYLRAGDAVQADRLYTAALAKLPDDPDLLIDRAFARADAQRFKDAVADLDAAIAKAPGRADAFLYRAGAQKALGALPRALADVNRALEIRPSDPEALLLRGNIKAAQGDLKMAAEDWRSVDRLAPDTTSARSARANLQRIAAVEAAKPAPAGKAPTPSTAPAKPSPAGTRP